MKRLAFVIEDDFDASNIAATALDLLDYKIEVISTGDKAQERLTKITPDLIILDLHLPRVSGAELLDYISSQKRFEKTIVFVVSADALIAETLRAKADLVLLKPVAFSQLHALASRFQNKT